MPGTETVGERGDGIGTAAIIRGSGRVATDQLPHDTISCLPPNAGGTQAESRSPSAVSASVAGVGEQPKSEDDEVSRETGRSDGGPVLSDRENLILRAMQALNAVDAGRQQETLRIARKAEVLERIEEPIARLKELGLVATNDGRGCGCWLTAEGAQLAISVQRFAPADKLRVRWKPTERTLHVIELMRQGKTNDEIADLDDVEVEKSAVNLRKIRERARDNCYLPRLEAEKRDTP